VILIKQIREEHRADSDKTNQRSYWNTWVILIKQIRGVNTGVILIKQIRGVNTAVILIKQIRGVNTGVILIKQIRGVIGTHGPCVHSSDLFYQNHPCVLL
jgi:hypothetical protein